MLYLLVLIFCIIPPVIIYLDFLVWVIDPKSKLARARPVLDKIILLFVLVTLAIDLGSVNDCCGDSALFSPQHRLTADVLILLSVAAYLYSTLRRRLGPPLLELAANCLMLVALPLNVFVGIQNDFSFGWWLGHVPLELLFIMALVENHWLALNAMEELHEEDSRFIAICRHLLYLPAWQKLPVLVIVCLPLLAALLGVLLLCGQRPDSIVRAFTDTYKHGFSQLDYQCDNVRCGGHFLCSVAAKGDRGLVKPIRSGVRGGKPIQCNRQLLVSNAFEELLEQRVSWLHRPVRRAYNRVGVVVRRYDRVFEKTGVANVIYVLMKPAEWMFLFVLYCFDRRPEDRIAQQYLRWEDRAAIKSLLPLKR
jgi:hypothetical protein